MSGDKYFIDNCRRESNELNVTDQIFVCRTFVKYHVRIYAGCTPRRDAMLSTTQFHHRLEVYTFVVTAFSEKTCILRGLC